MADYLLDTNILSYWYDGAPGSDGHPKSTHQNVSRNVARVRAPNPATGYISRLFISTVTLGEIVYGHGTAPTPGASKQGEYMKFIREQCPEVLDITRHVAENYGQMKAWLFNRYPPKSGWSKKRRTEQLENPDTGYQLQIDENDLWIAAQAMTHSLVFVTNDSRGNFGKVLSHFSTSLRVENWAA